MFAGSATDVEGAAERLSAIGLDLLQLKVDDPGTAIAIAVTAALGAWAGAKVLERTPPAPVKTA